MKVEVIECNSLEEVLAHVMNLACTDCNCVNRSTEPEEIEKPPLDFFIKRIADKVGKDFLDTLSWLEEIAQISPISSLSMVLREIAIWCDSFYKDHIKDSEEIYIISSLNGKISKLNNKKNIKSYKNFSAFRTLEDAKYACSILKHQLRKMFKPDAKRK